MIPWVIPMCPCGKRATVPGTTRCAQCSETPPPAPESVEWVGPPCDGKGDHGDCIRWCRVAYTKESYK
jgi:hypothetical protein